MTHGNPTIIAPQHMNVGDHQQNPQFVIGQSTTQNPMFHIPQPLDQWSSSQPPLNRQQIVHRDITASGVTRSGIFAFPPEGYRELARGADGLRTFERISTGEIYTHSELLEVLDWIDMYARMCERPAVQLERSGTKRG